MNEEEAWQILFAYSQRAGIRIEQEMTTALVRRALAKKYQPRQVHDNDRDMRQINNCLDVVQSYRDRRELLGQTDTGFGNPPPTKPASSSTTGYSSTSNNANAGSSGSSSRTYSGFGSGKARGGTNQRQTGGRGDKPGVEPWQTDVFDPCVIERLDYSDVNFIKKTVYQRSVGFGNVELVRVWGWAERRFQKVISVYANEFAFEELGRAMMFLQANGGDVPIQCDAIFLTQGSGPPQRFRLILIRSGRYCEDTSKHQFYFECDPNDPALTIRLPAWLRTVEDQLWEERSRW